MSEFRIDPLLPPEMATHAENLGVRKAQMPAFEMFTLSILAGAFIALGAMFATVVGAGGMSVTSPGGTGAFSATLPYGVVRLLVGIVFSLGLILVVVGGAELFTGNNLIVMAWASGKVTGRALFRNWLIVYAGNFVGAIGTAALVLLSRQYTFGASAVGIAALNTASAKCELGLLQALVLGILGNALVCMAVWLTFSARSTVDKIAAIILPITAFVAAGFEHSIANMYFIPYALLLRAFDAGFVGQVADKVFHLDSLTWANFLFSNLIPVTFGNIIGGTVLVAAVYWSVFLHNRST